MSWQALYLLGEPLIARVLVGSSQSREYWGQRCKTCNQCGFNDCLGSPSESEMHLSCDRGNTKRKKPSVSFLVLCIIFQLDVFRNLDIVRVYILRYSNYG